jgi:diamine N-acetyltransferase
MADTYTCKELYVTVIHDNHKAIRFYEKVGFAPTGEIEQGHHPELIYRLKLDQKQPISITRRI